MVNFIAWFIVGSASGWLVSLVTHTDAQQGVMVNMSAGAVGASIAELALVPILGISAISAHHFSMPALLVPLLGVILMLTAVRIFGWRKGLQR